MPKTALAIQDVRRDLKITSRKKKAVNSGEPITSLVARHSRMNILDEPLPDIVAEHDTFISGTGDGDTIQTAQAVYAGKPVGFTPTGLFITMILL